MLRSYFFYHLLSLAKYFVLHCLLFNIFLKLYETSTCHVICSHAIPSRTFAHITKYLTMAILLNCQMFASGTGRQAGS